MRLALTLLLAVLTTACTDDYDSIPPSAWERYSLLTWTSRTGELCFALMPIRERAAFLRRWFPKRQGTCGLADLKSAIERLPDGVAVMWEDIPRRNFTYPAARVCDEVVEFATAHHAKVVFVPVLVE